MVVWTPQTDEMRRVYNLCRAMGAPQFLSPEQMMDWVQQNSAVVENFLFNTYRTRLRVAPELYVRELILFFDEIYSHVSNLIEELGWLIFKAFHKPLTLNPRSLHPIGSVA